MRVPLQYKQMVAMGGVPDACDCRGRSELGGSSVGDDRCSGEGHGEYESTGPDLVECDLQREGNCKRGGGGGDILGRNNLQECPTTLFSCGRIARARISPHIWTLGVRTQGAGLWHVRTGLLKQRSVRARSFWQGEAAYLAHVLTHHYTQGEGLCC
jgi:hypothetical protein